MLKNKKNYKLIAATIIAIFLVFIVGFAAKDKISSKIVSSSPQYVVSHAIDAYNQHDVNSFNMFVDTTSVSTTAYNSWKTYKTNSFNRAFIAVPANSQSTFNTYINQLVRGQLTIQSQTTKGNVGIGTLTDKISGYKITNEKTSGDTTSFDVVLKTDNTEIVVPMTMMKSGDNYKINSVNLTNLFVAYDNEVKAQYIAFSNSVKKYDVDNTKVLTNRPINIGPFTVSTYGEATATLTSAQKELNDGIAAFNNALRVYGNPRLSDMNDVSRVFSFYAVSALKYKVNEYTIKLYVVEHVLPSYKASNPNEEVMPYMLYLDGYMEAKERISKLGNVKVMTDQLEKISALNK